MLHDRGKSHMARPGRLMGALVLVGVVGLGAGCEGKAASAECYDGVCDPGENYSCPADCLPPCDHDGVCDPGEFKYTCDDCYYSCDMGMTGPDYDVIVSEVFWPTNTAEAAENGVDIDGDGDIDNKLGRIFEVMNATGFGGDLNQAMNYPAASRRVSPVLPSPPCHRLVRVQARQAAGNQPPLD